MVGKTSLAQDLVWRLEDFGFAAYGALMRVIPIDWASNFGAWLLKTLGPLTGSHKTAARNLRLAFPDMPKAERARLLEAQWDNLGRTFAEFSLMDRIAADPSRIEVVGREHLDAIRDGTEAAVMVGGHCANWECLAVSIVQSGIKCQVTYRAANNPYVDKRIRDNRAAYGVELFAPKGVDGARELMEGMARGESVGLMNDQKFNDGVEVMFFGKPVHAAPGPSRLAVRFGAPIQPMWVERTGPARFRVFVHPPFKLARTSDRQADIATGVQRITSFIEERIRARPGEWFWVHKRWPNAAYAALEPED